MEEWRHPVSGQRSRLILSHSSGKPPHSTHLLQLMPMLILTVDSGEAMVISVYLVPQRSRSLPICLTSSNQSRWNTGDVGLELWNRNNGKYCHPVSLPSHFHSNSLSEQVALILISTMWCWDLLKTQSYFLFHCTTYSLYAWYTSHLTPEELLKATWCQLYSFQPIPIRMVHPWWITSPISLLPYNDQLLLFPSKTRMATVKMNFFIETCLPWIRGGGQRRFRHGNVSDLSQARDSYMFWISWWCLWWWWWRWWCRWWW